MQIPPDICWAALLAAGEMVEVIKTCTGQTFHLPMEIGDERAVVLLPYLANYFKPGDPISLLSFSLVADSDMHSATQVEVGDHNTPIAIRTKMAVRVAVHPSYVEAPIFPERTSAIVTAKA